MNRLAALALAAMLRLFSWLPLRAGRRVARGLVWLACRFGSEAERVTRINLEICFPELGEAELERLTRDSLYHTLCIVIESGMIAHWSKPALEATIVSEVGRDLLEKELSTPRGVLVLLTHFGNWDLFACAVGDLDYVALYDPPRIGTLDDAIRRSRERFGGTMVPVTAQGLRQVYKALGADRLAILLPDQVPDENAGVYAPFFGRPALTMTFVHRLAQRTGAFVMLASARRVEGGFAIEYAPLDDEFYAEDPQTCLAALNRAIERLVQTDVAQYQWEYKRFKKQPEGWQDVYRKAR